MMKGEAARERSGDRAGALRANDGPFAADLRAHRSCAWNSQIDLENVAVAHPGVAEAAAIGIPQPTWSERPILFVVSKAGRAIDRETVLAFLDGKVAKWWLPADVILIAELPHTATGKISKRTLRERHAAAFA